MENLRPKSICRRQRSLSRRLCVSRTAYIVHLLIWTVQPPRISSNYQDPADRVASTSNKAKADDIKTWSVSEVDKKGKKKKGTLGVGNGAVFFASESDKVSTPLYVVHVGSVISLGIDSRTQMADR
jgi:hypothetical protein